MSKWDAILMLRICYKYSLAGSFQQFSFREAILTIIHKIHKMDDEVKVYLNVYVYQINC